MTENRKRYYTEIRKREFDGKFVVWSFMPDPFYKHLQTYVPKTWISIGVFHRLGDAEKLRKSHDYHSSKT